MKPINCVEVIAILLCKQISEITNKLWVQTND